MTKTKGQELDALDAGLPVSAIAKILLKHNPEDNNTLAFVGRPGIGKTQVVEQTGIARGKLLGRTITVHTILGSQLEPTDFSGIPFADLDAKCARFLTHHMFTQVKEGDIVHFDELNRAGPQVQNAMYRPLLNGICGELVLPPNVLRVASLNPPNKANAVYPLAAPLKDRLIIIPVSAFREDWIAWAIAADINPVVISFIHKNAAALSPPFPQNNRELTAHATPRSWASVSRTINEKNSPEIQRAKIIGTVGIKYAQDFLTYQVVGERMPAPSDVLDGKIKFPQDADLMYAVCVSMVQELIQRLQRSPTEDFTALTDFFSVAMNSDNEWPKEMTAVAVTGLVGNPTSKAKVQLAHMKRDKTCLKFWQEKEFGRMFVEANAGK